MISANSARTISIREVQRTVARAFNLTVAEMLSPTRVQPVASARQIAMYLSREVAARRSYPVDRGSVIHMPAPPSFPRIGIAFDRDHSSVMHACRKVRRRLRDDLGFALLIDRLATDVRAHAALSPATQEAA
ncbi:MAG TPA: helix-turn-helix domain-containing protein [Candidatus Binataceae bacterium]|jgi:chromosomal replication initiator protein